MQCSDAPSDVIDRLFDLYGADYRDLAALTLRERLAGARRLLIFGAGQNGLEVLRLMRQAGLEPEAFVDDTPAKLGTTHGGVPVISAQSAAEAGGGVAVVSIFSPAADYLPIAHRLGRLHIDAVPLFGFLWAYGEESLPFYFLSEPSEIIAARQALAWLWKRLDDAPSRRLLERQVEFRLSLRYEALPPWTLAREPAPAHWDAFHVIDTGAFDGDTLTPLLEAHEGRVLTAVAVEPDPVTYERLRANLALTRVRAGAPVAIRAAIDRARGRRAFSSLAHQGSRFADDGVAVDTLTIDEIVGAHCAGDAPLYIKFDVEGAEAAALEGARETISRRRAMLSVAAYHQPSDLWALAQQIAGINDGYGFRLRSHGADGADLTLYAMPPA